MLWCDCAARPHGRQLAACKVAFLDKILASVGIFIVRAAEIGFIHPPMGMNLYVIQGIAPDVPLSRIFRGVLPFLAADFLHLLLLILFPALVLALPG